MSCDKLRFRTCDDQTQRATHANHSPNHGPLEPDVVPAHSDCWHVTYFGLPEKKKKRTNKQDHRTKRVTVPAQNVSPLKPFNNFRKTAVPTSVYMHVNLYPTDRPVALELLKP